MTEEKIKPVGYLKVTKTNKSHIAELIRRETGTQSGGKIPYVISSNVVLLYNPNLNWKELVASIDTLKGTVKLRGR